MAFRVRDMLYAPDESQLRHEHDELQLSIVLRGTIDEDVAGVAYRGRAGDVVFKPARIPHADAFAATRILCIDADPRDVELPHRAYGWHRSAPVTAAALRLAQTYFAGADIAGELDDLLALLPAPRQRDRVLATKAARALEDDDAISIDSLANGLGVHRVYLARVFREQWGCGPREYAQQLRVRAAAHRIASTREPLADVALAAGYSDQSHMSRAFAKRFGVPPGAFRRLTRR